MVCGAIRSAPRRLQAAAIPPALLPAGRPAGGVHASPPRWDRSGEPRYIVGCYDYTEAGPLPAIGSGQGPVDNTRSGRTGRPVGVRPRSQLAVHQKPRVLLVHVAGQRQLADQDLASRVQQAAFAPR